MNSCRYSEKELEEILQKSLKQNDCSFNMTEEFTGVYYHQKLEQFLNKEQSFLKEKQEFKDQCERAAKAYLGNWGHEETCHTVLYPLKDGDIFSEGCNCVVADIERGCIGDVVAYLIKAESGRYIFPGGKAEIL